MYSVLLVDDEELERKVLRLTLLNSDLPIKTCDEAANGREALLKVHQIHPDLIIMDIKMPGIDGVEATRQIKALYPTTEVLILTAYSEFSYSQRAIKAQATDYLLKPVQPQELIIAVKQALDRLSLKKFHSGPAINLTFLEEQVKTRNIKEAQRELTLLFKLLAAKELNLSASVFYSFGLRLMVIVVQAVLSSGADPGEVSALENNLTLELSHLSSLEELTSWGEVMLEKSIGLLNTHQKLKDQALVRKAMDYIETHYGESITLDMASAYVHLSPAYLSRIFSKKTGIGFTEYLTQLRLKRAKQQLRMTTDTIDNIAAATGFSSSSYFSAVFKKHEGITPSEYRATPSDF